MGAGYGAFQPAGANSLCRAGAGGRQAGFLEGLALCRRAGAADGGCTVATRRHASQPSSARGTPRHQPRDRRSRTCNDDLAVADAAVAGHHPIRRRRPDPRQTHRQDQRRHLLGRCRRVRDRRRTSPGRGYSCVPDLAADYRSLCDNADRVRRYRLLSLAILWRRPAGCFGSSPDHL